MAEWRPRKTSRSRCRVVLSDGSTAGPDGARPGSCDARSESIAPTAAVVRLTTDGGDDFGPAWSPDGQWLAWSTGTFSPANQLWIMKSDGTGARILTYGGDPSWSPESRRIAFNVLQFNVVRVCLIDIATSRVVQITH